MDRKEIDGHIIDLDMMGDKPVIIDAGCNRGDFIGFTDENFDTSFIYAIECDVRHVKYLNETYLNHNDLKFYDNALYGVDGEEVIFTQFNGQKKGDGTDRYHQWGNIVGVNKDFLGKIPLNQDLRESADEGKPLTFSNPQHEISLIFKEIANKILKKI